MEFVLVIDHQRISFSFGWRRTASLRASLAGLLLFALSVAAAGEKNTQVIADAVYLKPQQLVAIEEGRRLNIYCTGKGSPTVIFDSGLGDPMMVWALVQPRVAAVTRACSYDRAGLGFSDPSPRPRTSEQIVEELHRLLLGAQIKPPYVLVGHSFGGMNIKLYAQTYGPDVAGLVFVDPSHEDLAKRSWELDPDRGRKNTIYMSFLQACLEAQPTDFVEGSKLKQLCATPPNAARFSEAITALQLERAVQPGYRAAWISEQQNVWSASAAQLRAARRPLGDIPLIVLTHDPLPRQGDEAQAMTDAQNDLRTTLHADIARMSTRGTIRTVHDSGHHFQLDQPEEVATAVLEVVKAASRR
jgi:pimeloyl-ACP methyl ester carboxylesterase